MVDDAGPLLVLDTHVWLWAVEGMTEAMSPQSVDALQAAGRRGLVAVSAISVWEVAMLEARGRISLSRPVEEWVRAALRAPGVRLLELSPEIAVESTRLPGALRGDPADRMLAASARITGGRLATRDRALVEYARLGHLEVLDVTP
ncbi:MAG: type II toxin-antitoxin system VapC family toxin [Longimicrobiales bacterium]|nr:type II toxin-antitoxin system VapC family toxin [Longimicrobiales bacterium]